MTQYYLRSDTFCEPLVNLWYAWPLLISPATAALVTTYSQKAILESYIKMPKMHELAVNNPKMRGGPFVNFQGKNRVHEVENYLAQINQSSLHALAKALKQLNELVITADGHSHAALYSDIPEILKGYVELVYDLNNNPGFRILEGLLYKSPFYETQNQSLLLAKLAGDYREFALSTPRLDSAEKMHWKIPFKAPEIDKVFSSRETPIPQAQLQALFETHFEANATNKALFFSLFSEQAPVKQPQIIAEPVVRLRYFGHACVLIETKSCSILIDPMISYVYDTPLSRYTYQCLPQHIDYVIFTHSHQDHVMLEHLLQLRYKIGTLVVPKNASGMLQDPSLKLLFKQLNFNRVIELDEMESIALPEGELIGIPFFGEHGDLYIQSKMAYVLKLKEKTLLFAADSDNLEPRLYEHLHKEIGKIDCIFLGMECEGAPMSWLYGALQMKTLTRTMDQSRRLNGSNAERALEIIREFDCQQIYIYAMGREPWLGYITSIEYTEESLPIIEANKLIGCCQKDGRHAEMLYLEKEINL